MSKKLTPWFSPSIKPAYVGCYETVWIQGISPKRLRAWDGQQWCWTDGRVSSLQQFEWRGLAKKP